jgi:hypothetical protein
MFKGGGPRVPSRFKMIIYQMSVYIDLTRVSCFGRLYWRTLLGTSCLEIARSDEIRSGAPMFYWDRLVSEGALRSSAGCYHRAIRFNIPW